MVISTNRASLKNDLPTLIINKKVSIKKLSKFDKLMLRKMAFGTTTSLLLYEKVSCLQLGVASVFGAM